MTNKPTDRDLSDRDTPLDADKLMPIEKINELRERSAFEDWTPEEAIWALASAQTAHYAFDLWQHSSATNAERIAELETAISALMENTGLSLSERMAKRIVELKAERMANAAQIMRLREALESILNWNDGSPPLGDEPWLEMCEIARLSLATNADAYAYVKQVQGELLQDLIKWSGKDDDHWASVAAQVIVTAANLFAADESIPIPEDE